MTDSEHRQRERLLAEIRIDAQRTETFTGRGEFGAGVMAALGRIPRDAFVPAASRGSAYLNRPLPIGHRQTISQPYIVALMTDLLDLGPDDRVLEIGTGCGYQTAVLAELAAEVVTVEVIGELQEDAKRRLDALGYSNIRYQCGNGRLGWPSEAPYDAIIVTAAPTELPPALPEQLAPGGRMVIPIGGQHRTQFLTRYLRDSDGGLTEEPGLPVAFVPLVRS